MVAGSAAAAETIATYTGLQASLPLCTSLAYLSALSPFLDARVIVVRIDNKQVLALARKGESDKLFLTCKSANIRANALAELRKTGFAEFAHCKTTVQRADLFTKVLEKF